MSLEGKRIKHPKYGEGSIVSKIGGAFTLLVKFDSGITFYVRRDECQFLEPKNSFPSLIATFEPRKIPFSTDLKAASFLETLRLGIVPGDVSEFTFGRDSELDRIDKWILEPRSPPLVIVGDYGSGKTHLLQCLEDKYLKLGWAISSFQLDPNECQLNRPKRVYSKIIKTLKVKKDGEDLGFRDLMKEYLSMTAGSVGQDYLDLILDMCRHRYASNEYAWDWIEGIGPLSCYSGLPLYDDAPSANIYCSILSGIANLAVKSGHSGFMIMLDESEQISGSWYATLQFLKGLDFLVGLTLTSSTSELLREETRANYEPNARMRIMGSKSGLPYSARKPIPYCSSGWVPFKVILAFSNIDQVKGTVYHRLGCPPVVPIKSLDNKAKREIMTFIYQLYCLAYPSFNYNEISCLMEDIIESRKCNENVRMLVKGFIEALDIIRYHRLESHRSFLY